MKGGEAPGVQEADKEIEDDNCSMIQENDLSDSKVKPRKFSFLGISDVQVPIFQ